MSRDHDMFVNAIERWLEQAPGYEDPESVLERVISDLEGTSQRHPWWPVPPMPMSKLLFRIGLVSAVVLVVSLVGLRLIGSSSLGGPAADATPLPTASPKDRLSSLDPDCATYGGPPFPNPASVAPPDAGFIGLPPANASPSSPVSGELVDCYPVHGEPPYEGMVRLYADGRLIWLSYYDNHESGPGENSRSTGFLEQRLTPEGVQRVIDHGDISEKHPLRLAEWMPASGWLDQTIRPYVPAGYAACLVVENWEDPFEELTLTLPEKLAILPPAAANFLLGREAVPSDAYDSSSDCLGMTTAEARQLDGILSGAGLDQDEFRNRYLLEYHVDFVGPDPDAWWLGIWFEPILPDGIITCTSCG